MTKLSEHTSSKFVKLLFIGDSSTGKTGSLASLVQAGYKLKILDFDNGIPILKAIVKRDCPEFMDNVDVETVQDVYVGFDQSGAKLKPNSKKAFAEAIALMQKWSDGSTPSEWGPDTIFVCDSLTRFGTQAYEYCKGLNPTAKEGRTWYFAAQKALESFLATITGDDFHAHVIVISHVSYKEMQGGILKGWPSSIGQALGPDIPTYFNSMVLAETMGMGADAKRVIRTVPTGVIDLKIAAAPKSIDATLPLSTGMATLFQLLKD